MPSQRHACEYLKVRYDKREINQISLKVKSFRFASRFLQLVVVIQAREVCS